MPQHTWTRTRYDAAQTLACDILRIRTAELLRLATQAADASPTDGLLDILGDLRGVLVAAERGLDHILRDQLEEYDTEPVPCDRCGRVTQARYPCVCRG